MRAYRIADRRHPIFDATGARLVGGRWNSPGYAVIYCSETYAGALLEVLVHANIGRMPDTQAYIEIDLPDTMSREVVAADEVPGWDADDQRASRAVGDRWIEERRSTLLFVPSLVSGGLEHNVLINPAHPDSAQITVSEPRDVHWDRRLFRRDKAR